MRGLSVFAPLAGMQGRGAAAAMPALMLRRCVVAAAMFKASSARALHRRICEAESRPRRCRRQCRRCADERCGRRACSRHARQRCVRRHAASATAEDMVGATKCGGFRSLHPWPECKAALPRQYQRQSCADASWPRRCRPHEVAWRAVNGCAAAFTALAVIRLRSGFRRTPACSQCPPATREFDAASKRAKHPPAGERIRPPRLCVVSDAYCCECASSA